ncbi:MAG: nucleotidyltransferase [Chloroflexi bacterium]|nr:nucleotidyltransferase [Chloroflexota bacterium]
MKTFDKFDPTTLQPVVQALPYPPLFVTISGAHLYGFPSPDSDVDLRGAYVLPLRAVLGLDAPEGTVSQQFERDGREMDIVAHDVRKFLTLLLKKNGYVLEQLYSPLVVQGGAAFEELRALAGGAIIRHVYHHYKGFSFNQIKMFEQESPRRVKTLLYVFRVLLTGIWLLQTGEVEANLIHLNETFRLPFIPDLIAQKVKERAALDETEMSTYQDAIVQLQAQLETAFAETTLPDTPSNRDALNDFLVRVRLEYDRG